MSKMSNGSFAQEQNEQKLTKLAIAHLLMSKISNCSFAHEQNEQKLTNMDKMSN